MVMFDANYFRMRKKRPLRSYVTLGMDQCLVREKFRPLHYIKVCKVSLLYGITSSVVFNRSLILGNFRGCNAPSRSFFNNYSTQKVDKQKKLFRGLRKYDKIENLTTEVYDQQFNGSDVFAVNNQVIT